MKIVSAKNPARSKNGGVDIMVTFEGLGEIPFHATAGDTEPHGRELYARAMNGEFGPVAPYVAPTVPVSEIAAQKIAAIRASRHAVEFGGMVHDGVMYDSDATARAKYGETRDVFALMPDLEIEGWKASDGPDGLGVYVTMTKALLDALTLAGAAHDKACFDWERDRQAEVAAAMALENEAEARVALLAISETM